MADIQNRRDVILQTAANRFVQVDAAGNVVPAKQGITLSRSIDMFVGRGADSSSYPYLISPDRMVLTAQLQGIPVTVPVVWKKGYFGDDTVHQGFYETQTGIILTDTADQLVKTIEASSYPKNGRTSVNVGIGGLPQGYVQVSVTYNGQTYAAFTGISTFNG